MRVEAAAERTVRRSGMGNSEYHAAETQFTSFGHMAASGWQ
jgi:hypothetical protein